MNLPKSFSFKSALSNKKSNVGYFCNNGIHLYGKKALDDYNDCQIISTAVNNLYGKLCGRKFNCIGQDIFGNQFFKENNRFYYLNIETSEIDKIGDSENEFLNNLILDQDYYSGNNLINELKKEEIIKLSQGFRLCAKKPFVIGGSYENKNIYFLDTFKNLTYNFSIARQIYHLPDGAPVKLEII